MSVFGRLIPLVGLIFLPGCTFPKAAYQQVDQTSPAFKEAVASETQRQATKGVPAAAAEKKAIQRVNRQFTEAEKARRTEQVAPLLQALVALEQPHGCWACTATTTINKDGTVEVQVEHYDPFQPEERLWTLISYNGTAPDEKAQADYRKAKLREWKKMLAGKKSRIPESEWVKLQALFYKFEVTGAPSARMNFTFVSEAVSGPIGDIPSVQDLYLVENHELRRHTKTRSGSTLLLAGAIRSDPFESVTDYILIEPSLPPFVARISVRYHDRILGTDSGNVTRETVYTDYHRVKCYEDRFETKVGAPDMMDFIPDHN